MPISWLSCMSDELGNVRVIHGQPQVFEAGLVTYVLTQLLYMALFEIGAWLRGVSYVWS